MAISTRHWRSVAVSIVTVLAVTALGVTACDNDRGKKSSVAGSMAAPIVAATVNGKPIYIADVESEAVAKGIVREGEDFETDSDVFYQVLEDLIESRLLAMEAEKRELDRNADVRHRLERARDLILSAALSEQIRDTAIDEAAVEKMYREQVRLLKGKREVHLRHAVFPTKDAALAAKRRLDAGQSTFEEVAYDLSMDRKSGPEGGDMGFQKPDDLPDGLRQAVLAVNPGQMGGPVQVGSAWELFRVEERREGEVPSIDSMRPQLERWLMFEELRQVVDKLKGQARIERILEENRAQSGRDGEGEAQERRRPRPARPLDTSNAPIGPGAIAGASAGTQSPIAAPVLGEGVGGAATSATAPKSSPAPAPAKAAQTPAPPAKAAAEASVRRRPSTAAPAPAPDPEPPVPVTTDPEL